MRQQPGIVIQDLRFRYGGGFSLSLDRMSFQPGEISVILGPNGSGKSTLLSLLRGRLKPSAGTVRVFGEQLPHLSGRERAALVGLVPQLSEIPFGFTVQEVVRMGGFRFGRFRAEMNDQAVLDAILEQTDLMRFRDRSVSRLSGGEFQRVLLARTLYQDPRVLLLDEPANHLDLYHQEHLLRLLKQQAEKGKTVVAILHDINQALHYGDRCYLLKDGGIAFSGPVAETLTPAHIETVYGVKMDYFRSSNDQQSKAVLGPVFEREGE